MYRDSFQETGFQRFLRAISKSFRLGHFFRVEVRVFWLALVIMPLILLRNTKGLPFVEGTAYIAIVTILLYVVIWSHEMGHIAAGRRYGIQTPLITLSPLGGLAHMSSGAPSPAKEIIIALAGPVTHLVWLVPIIPLSILLDYGDLKPDSWSIDPAHLAVGVLLRLNIALFAFNLLPFFPMDGGRALRGFLARKTHPNRATAIATKVGTFGGWAIILVGIYLWIATDDLWGPILIAIGISNLMACKQERLASQYSAGPYMQSDPMQPWQADPDSWKGGGAYDLGGNRGAGKRSEKQDRKLQKRLQRQQAETAAFDEQVDSVLARVNEVGLEGLTRRERAILKKASERRRKK